MATDKVEVSAPDYTEDKTVTVHATHHDHKVEFTSDITDQLSGDFDDRVNRLVDGRVKETVAQILAENKVIEDKRAFHRNLNRMLTLAGALVIGFVVTFLFQHKGLPGVFAFSPWFVKTWAPYTFIITIAMDGVLAAYGLLRRY